jgi:hypothetical protein
VGHHPGLGHPLLQAFVGEQRRVRERVAGVGVDGRDGRRTGREVVGVARADPDPVALRALDQHALRPDLADDPADVPAQVLGRLERAVPIHPTVSELIPTLLGDVNPVV